MNHGRLRTWFHPSKLGGRTDYPSGHLWRTTAGLRRSLVVNVRIVVGQVGMMSSIRGGGLVPAAFAAMCPSKLENTRIASSGPRANLSLN